jgi:hypothetical protein
MRRLVLQRLDVDVRGPFAQGFAEDLVHEIHHRHLLLLLIQLGDLLRQVVSSPPVGSRPSMSSSKCSAPDAVAPPQSLHDAVAGADHPRDVLVQIAAHGLLRASGRKGS